VGVNKTLEYALSEALEKGYRAGRIGDSFDEMALRERIAQELELNYIGATYTTWEDGFDGGIKKAIEIVRKAK
jgi:hypothetical protein